jgi:hypothetical protein
MSLQRFKSGGSIIVNGQTGSGKSYFVKRLIENIDGMFTQTPQKILYYYSIYQPLFDSIDAEFHKGLPKIEQIEDLCQKYNPILLILDDVMDMAVKSQEIELLFTRGCHHYGLNLIYLVQNLYQQGKNAKTISLNSWYTVLFRNPRDVNQISVLDRQLGLNKLLVRSYNDAMKTPYNYIVVDTSPGAEYVVKSRIFPGEDPIIYLP